MSLVLKITYRYCVIKIYACYNKGYIIQTIHNNLSIIVNLQDSLKNLNWYYSWKVNFRVGGGLVLTTAEINQKAYVNTFKIYGISGTIKANKSFLVIASIHYSNGVQLSHSMDLWILADDNSLSAVHTYLIFIAFLWSLWWFSSTCPWTGRGAGVVWPHSMDHCGAVMAKCYMVRWHPEWGC